MMKEIWHWLDVFIQICFPIAFTVIYFLVPFESNKNLWLSVVALLAVLWLILTNVVRISRGHANYRYFAIFLSLVLFGGLFWLSFKTTEYFGQSFAYLSEVFWYAALGNFFVINFFVTIFETRRVKK